MSRCVITIDYDEDAEELTVHREHDPPLPKGAELEDVHCASIYGAIAYEAIDQATDAMCTRCAATAVTNLRHMADSIHAGHEVIKAQAGDPTKH